MCFAKLIFHCAGDCRWCLCFAFSTAIPTRYQSCCGKSYRFQFHFFQEKRHKMNFLAELILAPQVGGVHFSLLSKVRHDIGDTCSLDYLIDSIFPLFRKHIEPDLHHAQVGCRGYFFNLLFYMFIYLFISSLASSTD